MVEIPGTMDQIVHILPAVFAVEQAFAQVVMVQVGNGATQAITQDLIVNLG